MTEIKINLSSFNSYLKDNNIMLSDNDFAQISSIFSQCDIIDEAGIQKPDGKLTGDEVLTFQKLIMEKMSKLGRNLRNYIDSLANPEDVKKTIYTTGSKTTNTAGKMS